MALAAYRLSQGGPVAGWWWYFLGALTMPPGITKRDVGLMLEFSGSKDAQLWISGAQQCPITNACHNAQQNGLTGSGILAFLTAAVLTQPFNAQVPYVENAHGRKHYLCVTAHGFW